MTPKKNSYFNLLSDDMALGFFDADGSVLMNTTFRKNSVLRNTLGFQVLYFVGQSLSKVESVQKFATKFGRNVPRQECRMNQSSPAGQKVRQFLLENNPKHPDRRRDFFLSEEVLPQQKGVCFSYETNTFEQLLKF